MESLIGWGVGYTHRNTGTRCPVRYVLRSGTNYSYRVGGRPVASRKDLRAEVGSHMHLGVTYLFIIFFVFDIFCYFEFCILLFLQAFENALLSADLCKALARVDLGDKIVAYILVVEIQEPGMFDLDITDMPGMKDRGEADFEQLCFKQFELKYFVLKTRQK